MNKFRRAAKTTGTPSQPKGNEQHPRTDHNDGSAATTRTQQLPNSVLLEEQRKLHVAERKATQVIEDLEYKLKLSKQEATRWREENATILRDKKNLERRNEAVEKNNRQIGAQLSTLQQELGSLRSKNEYLHKINADGETLNNELCQEQERQKKEIAHLRQDNEHLRTYIAKTNTDVNPFHDEEYYLQSLQELKSEIEMWIAKHAKANGVEVLSAAEEAGVLEILFASGQCGKNSYDFLNRDFRGLYGNARSRIPLLRHVVALVLFEQIFEPFAAGLPSTVSPVLTWIEDDLMLRESETKALQIRQSLGRSTSGYVQGNIKDYEGNVRSKLACVLRNVLRKASENDIQKGATKFVTKAVTLKKALTEEQAVYRCYWVNCGQHFEPESAESYDGERGLVYFCMFPGLAKIIKGDVGRSMVYTFKASIVLKSALG